MIYQISKINCTKVNYNVIKIVCFGLFFFQSSNTTTPITFTKQFNFKVLLH